MPVQAPQLSDRIRAANLEPDVAHAFYFALIEVAEIDGPAPGDVAALIDRLVQVRWSPEDEPAPREALWQVADLFLTACLYVAVSNGEYSLEQARHISRLATAVGLSARQLGDLEHRVMRELAHRGAVSP